MVKKFPSKQRLLPPWNMPADPVKAVWWFMHWLLKVCVRYFWIAILAMVIYETYTNWQFDGVANGVTSGVTTLIVGLVVWGILFLILSIVNVTTRVSQVVSDINRFQQIYNTPPSDAAHPFRPGRSRPRVVEGTIIDIEEKRRERQ